MIQIENLSKRYGAKQVLHSINLHFEKGRVYGIVGENGAGKTTLFRCIAGLEPYTGSIHTDLPDLKNHLGLLFTDPFFFARMTGREYLYLLCHARGVSPGDLAQRNIFDLPLDEYAANYSTGMKKKLALTGILLQENSCYILDEPFNGVDIQSNMIITEIIHQLKAMGKTVLISSHIFSTLRDNCDEICLLRHGEVLRLVPRNNFDALEQEMKQFVIGDRLQRLDLK